MSWLPAASASASAPSREMLCVQTASRLRVCTRLVYQSTRASGVRARCVSSLVDGAQQTSSEQPCDPASPNSSSPWLSARVSKPLESALYLVATPIGNLEDISVRALNVLSQADTILAEDCRHSRKLLNHYGIHGSLVSYHQHNEEARCAEVTAWLAQGRIVALISDAGTPGISDPGSRAVTAAIAAGHRVVPVPGACAAIAALVASGMPTEAFLFLGFLPPKSGARRAQLEHLRQTVSATMIFYVPPHGLLATLEDMVVVLGPTRLCCVTRELTKMHETFHRATLQDALQHFTTTGVRGEIALLVRGSSDEDRLLGALPTVTSEDRIQELLNAGSSVSQVAKMVATEFCLRKKDVYAKAVGLQSASKVASKPDAGSVQIYKAQERP